MTNGNDFVNMTEDCYKDNTSGKLVYSYGLTKRELFAAMVYQGVISNRELQLSVTNDNKMTWQEYSVNLTDALIAELNKEVQS